MSKIALSPNASGTGTLSIVAPNTNTDRTLTLPDATGTVFVSGQALSATTGSFSGDVTLGSSVLATPSGSAPSYTCRAWVNFNGTGTVSISGSGNVSSITDNGTGYYTVNFTTAMPDNTYAVCATARNGSAFDTLIVSNELAGNSTTTARFWTSDSGGSLFDARGVSVAIFR